MIDTVAAAPESFGIIATFLRADLVVKGVMIGLAAASLWSWTVIIDRALQLGKLRREAGRFEDEVAKGTPLEDLARLGGENSTNPLHQLLQVALKESRGGRGTAEPNPGLILTSIDRAMDSIIASAARGIEEGLGVLAIVATASPFIGLFGTVWGIMNAFRNIALMKNTNLTVVAPSIAEALFATALGLAAAIPAYIAYNAFTASKDRLIGRMESFADDLASAVARRLADRTGG
jgi:biopolymer transport protein TolQ